MEFSINVFLKIKNVNKIKNVKTVKNVTGIKNVKNVFYIYGKEHNVKKYIQWVTTLSLTIRVYLHSFSCCSAQICEITRNFPKIRTYGS